MKGVKSILFSDKTPKDTLGAKFVSKAKELLDSNIIFVPIEPNSKLKAKYQTSSIKL